MVWWFRRLVQDPKGVVALGEPKDKIGKKVLLCEYIPPNVYRLNKVDMIFQCYLGPVCGTDTAQLNLVLVLDELCLVPEAQLLLRAVAKTADSSPRTLSAAI